MKVKKIEIKWVGKRKEGRRKDNYEWILLPSKRKIGVATSNIKTERRSQVLARRVCLYVKWVAAMLLSLANVAVDAAIHRLSVNCSFNSLAKDDRHGWWTTRFYCRAPKSSTQYKLVDTPLLLIDHWKLRWLSWKVLKFKCRMQTLTVNFQQLFFMKNNKSPFSNVSTF